MTRQFTRGIITTLVFCAGMFSVTQGARAAGQVVAVEGVGYNVQAGLGDNLKALLGKPVSVTTTAGKTYSGLVKAVGDHLLHLEKLEGKEYFDALILIERIDGMDTRFRTYQR